MVIKRIVGFVIMFVLMALAMENPLTFVNIPSALIVFGLILGGVMASGKCLHNLISINWKKNATSEELWSIAETYRYMKSLAMGSGVVGTLIGVILILKDIEDIAVVRSSMVIAILTIYYAVILKYFIFEPIVIRLEERAYETYSDEPGKFNSNCDATEVKNTPSANADHSEQTDNLEEISREESRDDSQRCQV